MNIRYNIINNFKLSIRNLMREKVYGLVSIAGLAIAMACAILVCTRVIEDLRYATYYENGDRIYRVLRRTQTDTGFHVIDWTPGGIAVGLREHFPEVEYAARATTSFFSKDWIKSGEITRREFFCFADPELIDMLGFEFIQGRLETFPGTVVVTENAAKRFFKDENPIGKIITKQPGSDYKITGVLKDIPKYAHIRIDFLAVSTPPNAGKSWDGWVPELWGPKNYIMLHEGSNVEEVEKKLNDLMAQSVDALTPTTLHLQPMTRAYLYGATEFGHTGESKMAYLLKLIAIALVIIIVACVNFINLAAARTLSRSREIATRKAMGAEKRDIILQFLTESLTVAFIAAILGLTLASTLPVYHLFGLTFTWQTFENPDMLIGLISIVFLVGLTAGLYPALLASRIQPVEGDCCQNTIKMGGFSVHNLLLVVQLSIATVFIISAFIIDKQVQNMTLADLGFDEEHIVTTRYIFTGDSAGKQDVVKQAFNRLPGVISATTIWPGPGAGEKPRRTVSKEKDPLTEYTMQILGIDPDFIKTYGMTLLAGRNVGPNFTSKDNAEFILNETALKRLGFDLDAPSGSDIYPLGQSLKVGEYRGTVIGVMKDFHYRSLHYAIEPMILLNWSRTALALRIKPDRVEETMASLNKTWKQFFTQPPSFGFIASWYNGYYGNQRREMRRFSTLATVAIFLSALGVFGLATYETEQRRREVGIRKVLGASIFSIVALFWKQHLVLVILANLIAWPVAYKMMNAWLQEFAYRIDLPTIPFLIATLTIGSLFLCIIGTQAIRIGHLNPTDTLRSE